MTARTTIAPGRWLAPEAAASYARMRDDGMPAGITSAGRTYDEQLALWRKQGHLGLAWHPDDPRARHMQGLALDLPEPARSWCARHGGAHGWWRPFAHEPWHFEYRATHDQHRNRKDDDMAKFTDQHAAWLEAVGRRAKYLDANTSHVLARAIRLEAQVGNLVAALAAVGGRGEPLDVAKLEAGVRASAEAGVTAGAALVAEFVLAEVRELLEQTPRGDAVDPAAVAEIVLDGLGAALTKRK